MIDHPMNNKTTPMKFFITGGTGLIGRAIQKHLISLGHSGTILTRSVKQSPYIYDGFRALTGDITHTDWLDGLANHDVLIHLAGYPLFQQRWSQEVKKQIQNSRVLGTQNLVYGIKKLPKSSRPTRIISASAVGYYGISSGHTILDEESPGGDDFLALIAKQWEESSDSLHECVDQLTIFRIGVVLSLDGGMLKRVIPIFRSGLGGRLADGHQWISWIHLNDVVQFFINASCDAHWIGGTYNLCAPHPVTNRTFTKTLGKLLRRPAFIPVPRAILTQILGEGSQYVTTGQRVVPKKLIQQSHTFQFNHINEALNHLVK